MARLPPRLSFVTREAILRNLVSQYRSTPVPVSRILRRVRKEYPLITDGDDALIRQIVLDATDHGLAVYFDKLSDEA